MKQIRRLCLWYRLLTKRLFKKPAFLILLFAVPLLGGTMALVSRQDAGVVTVALALTDDDPAAAAAAERLLTNRSVVRCVAMPAEEARTAVADGSADAAWIFRENASRELERFAAGKRTAGAVTVVEREDNVFLRLARERLAAALYPEVSRALFRDFLVNTLNGGEDIPDGTLEEYYTVSGTEQRIIAFACADGGEQDPSAGWLVSPVRGLLALLIVLAGLASCMYYEADETEGVFLRLSAGKRRLLPLLCHLCAMLPVALASLIALWAAGLLTGPAREIGLMLIFCIASAGFCEILRRLCRGQTRLGALLPILLAAMLALCPVFADLGLLRPAAYLLPPLWYLNGVYIGRFALMLIVYAAAATALAVLPPQRIR